MSGLILAPIKVGPTLEKDERTLSIVVDPTPITCSSSPGELAEPQEGPELPMENNGMIPADCQALMTSAYQVFPRPPPQLFETK